MLWECFYQDFSTKKTSASGGTKNPKVSSPHPPNDLLWYHPCMLKTNGYWTLAHTPVPYYVMPKALYCDHFNQCFMTRQFEPVDNGHNSMCTVSKLYYVSGSCAMPPKPTFIHMLPLKSRAQWFILFCYGLRGTTDRNKKKHCKISIKCQIGVKI